MAKRCISARKATPSQALSIAKTMTGSSEFTTWVALAGAAIVAGTARHLFVFAVGLDPGGAHRRLSGYKGEQAGSAIFSNICAQALCR